MKKIIAAVDIGATKITASLFSRDEILIRLYQRTRLEGTPETVPLQVMELLDRSLSMTGLGSESLLFVGISSAGPFFKEEGRTSLLCPNMCGGMNPERGLLPNDWVSIPLAKELEKRYQDLVIENDAVAGAIAERLFGAGRGSDNLLYVTWSTGIGTGAFVDGKLLRGRNGNAPHGGHIHLVDDGPPCGCGSHGHLESLASGMAIAREYGGGASTSDVLDAYKRGDSKAVEVVHEAARYLSRGLASMSVILDPDTIIIGGSVFLNNTDILLPLLMEEFFRSFPAMTKGVRVVPSELGEHLGDMGALSLVIPEEWIEEWRKSRPWEKAPATIVL
ncbi:MAG: ROK family protein [Candidatus Thermoplasmatota archaeon]|nr:ROK family protein [Candidatus Thermoplasmatota archaeon]